MEVAQGAHALVEVEGLDLARHGVEGAHEVVQVTEGLGGVPHGVGELLAAPDAIAHPVRHGMGQQARGLGAGLGSQGSGTMSAPSRVRSKSRVPSSTPERPSTMAW